MLCPRLHIRYGTNPPVGSIQVVPIVVYAFIQQLERMRRQKKGSESLGDDGDRTRRSDRLENSNITSRQDRSHGLGIKIFHPLRPGPS